MFIVEHARNTRYRSHRIAGDTVPGTARPVLLMKHRSCHKSRSRMPRRKRLVVRSVGAGHTAGIFQRVDRSGHQRDGKGIRHQHPAPRTAPPDSSDFQPQHQRCGSILQIIVIMETERRYIIVPQMTKSPIPLLHDQTCDNKGNSDIGYSIGTRRGYPLHIPDKRAAAEGESDSMYRPGRKRRSTPPAEGTATAISSFTKYKIPTASEKPVLTAYRQPGRGRMRRRILRTTSPRIAIREV